MTINRRRQAVSIVADAYGISDPDVQAVIGPLLADGTVTVDDVLDLIVDGLTTGAVTPEVTA